MKHRLLEFLRFCVVGLIAFSVDYALLELMVLVGFSAVIGRCISLTVALQVSYLLQGAFTFRDHGGYSVRRWLVFLGSNLIGALINYLTFLGVLHLSPLASGAPSRLLALVAGTAVALFFNYWANRRFVFTAKEQ